MAGQNPYEAFDKFKGPLQRALSCVTDAVFVALASDGCSPGMDHILTFNGGDAVRISDEESLALSVTFYYQIVEDDHPERGPWKVSTRAYMHALENLDGQEIVAYHWHPEQGSKVTFPHMHFGVGLGQLPKFVHKAHVPTGRVPLEEVVRFAIADLGATPKREDWSEVLADTQRAHERWRTWAGSGPSKEGN